MGLLVPGPFLPCGCYPRKGNAFPSWVTRAERQVRSALHEHGCEELFGCSDAFADLFQGAFLQGLHPCRYGGPPDFVLASLFHDEVGKLLVYGHDLEDPRPPPVPGVETLTEITEPEEVDRLAGICRQAHPDSTTAAFRQVFQQFAGQRTEGSDV